MAADCKHLKDLTKDMDSLKAKLTSLEAHSKRNNIVLVGLEEGLEAGDPNKMISDVLRYILDLKDSDMIPEVERHHRSLRPRPGPSEPPRPYLVRLLRWNDRQNILRAAGKKKQLTWKGKPLSVFQDLPVDIKRQRAEYADIKKKLRGTGLRYGLLYPARLIVSIEGDKHINNNPADAMRGLRIRLPSVFG